MECLTQLIDQCTHDGALCLVVYTTLFVLAGPFFCRFVIGHRYPPLSVLRQMGLVWQELSGKV